MDIKNTIISAEVVIGSLLVLLENENVDISSINFKVGSQEEGYESENMSFESLVNLTLKGLGEAKAQAVPEGFVLIKDDTKTVVAIERMVEQQVEASGMDSRRLERLDGWKIIEAAVKAQEPAND